jgi:DNA-binding beta-propeller fold protein YncE
LLVASSCVAGGIAVAPDGTVYVVDQGNGRVQYFKPVLKPN